MENVDAVLVWGALGRVAFERRPIGGDLFLRVPFQSARTLEIK